MSKKKLLKVEICMGSSCFSRGNNQSLLLIQSLVKENKINADVNLSGSLCSENCSKGPILIVDGKMYNQVHPDSVRDLLLHLSKEDSNE